VKPICSRAKIRIKSLPPGSRFLPVRVAALQPIPKADFLRDGEAQPGVINFHIARAGRKINVAPHGIIFMVGYDLFHVHSRRYRVPSQMSGIDHLRYGRVSKPQAAIQGSYSLALKRRVMSTLKAIEYIKQSRL
jgi:hypothetical protein